MKAASLTLLVIFFLVPYIAGQRFNEPVYDTDGNQVRPNFGYIIKTTSEYGNQWVSRDKEASSDRSCPQAVVVKTTQFTEVLFLLSSGATCIPLDTDISIAFSRMNHCVQTGIWNVENRDRTFYISATGSVVFPADTKFQIKKSSNGAYKFVHESIYNVGVDNQYLVLAPNPVEFIFVRNLDSSTSQ